MRFMIIVKATPTSEAGAFPPDTDRMFAAMDAFHAELARAGVLLDAAGLQPTSKGWRIRYEPGGARRVVDGPFTESKELIAGYTLIQVRSREEALEWARRFPNPVREGEAAEIELRQLYELEDFAHALPKVDEREIVSRRLLRASPREVFAAIADPQRLARWWGPKDFRNTFERFEFREGGTWDFTMHGPDGKDYANKSRFERIEPDACVVLQHVSAPHFRLTMTLQTVGQETLLEWRQCFETAALREQLAAVCVPANEENFDRLEAELARNR